MGVITGRRTTTMNPTNGKGDRYRKVDDKKYNDNWDRIFGSGSKEDTKEDAENLYENSQEFGQQKL